jgi:hypothetical protein
MLIRKEKGLKAKESVNKRWEKHRNESNTNVLRSESVNESVNETGIVIRDRGAGERVFIKPAREEIAVYVLSKYPDGLMEGANQFAELFWSHYENNGWKVGKNKMKNWKLALPQWADTLQKHLFPMQKNNPFQKPKKPTAQEAGMEAIQMYLQEQELERQSQNGTSI